MTFQSPAIVHWIKADLWLNNIIHYSRNTLPLSKRTSMSLKKKTDGVGLNNLVTNQASLFSYL